jgi:D-alanine-D-alanine ligase
VRDLILHDAVGADARPDELDALAQAEAVEAALRRVGYATARAPFATDLDAVAAAIRRAAPEVVFNLVESVARSGRLIHVAPALLETLRVPFTGAGADAMFLSSNKVLAKRVLAAHQIPTPAWHTRAELRAGIDVAPGRYLAKSVWEHGSLGLEADSVVPVQSAAELRAELEARLPALGGDAFAEAYVHGRELNVGLLARLEGGVECLPIPEILFPGLDADAARVVGYRSKWDPSSPEWHATPRRFLDAAEGELAGELQRLARATWDAFGLAGAARVDVRVDRGGRPFVIDVNANPCLAPDAGFAASLERAGIPFDLAVDRLVRDALARFGPTGKSRVPHPADRQ